jgi:ubiquinone/menaquinone biosynthesis C-methylase UbiE
MTELKSFDRVADVYDATRGLPPDAERMIADGIDAVLRTVAPSPRVLEVGVGTGRIAVPIVARGVRVTGIDIAPGMLAVLREKRRDISVMLAEAARPPFRDGVFDACLFVHILHLVPDAQATVRAALRVVRPGGLLVSGADDWSTEGVRDQADRIIREAVNDATGMEMRGWKPYDDGIEAFGAITRQHGATIERINVARWQSSTTAARMLQRLARKDFSSSWLIPDEALPGVIEAVRPRVERLFGGPEREVSFERSFSIDVARLP